MLTRALKEFESLTRTNEYDRKFAVYEDRLKRMFKDQMDAFLAGDKSKDYFTCTELEEAGKSPSRFVDVTCPSYHGFGRHRPPYRLTPVGRPYISGGLDHPSERKQVTFHLKDSKGFYEFIGKEYGIEESWVDFGKMVSVEPDKDCNRLNGKDFDECRDKSAHWWYGLPYVNMSKVKIYNPRKEMDESLDRVKGFLDRFGQLRDTSGHDELAVWYDISDAVSIPSLMVVNAVRSMKTLFEQVGEMEEKELTASLILWFSVVAMLLPLAGEAAAVAGMAAILRTAFHGTAMFLEVNVLALEIMNDPDNALFHVLLFTLGEGVGALLGRVQVAGAALARRAMTRRQIKHLGGVGKDLDRIQAIRMGVY